MTKAAMLSEFIAAMKEPVTLLGSIICQEMNQFFCRWKRKGSSVKQYMIGYTLSY